MSYLPLTNPWICRITCRNHAVEVGTKHTFSLDFFLIAYLVHSWTFSISFFSIKNLSQLSHPSASNWSVDLIKEQNKHARRPRKSRGNVSNDIPLKGKVGLNISIIFFSKNILIHKRSSFWNKFKQISYGTESSWSLHSSILLKYALINFPNKVPKFSVNCLKLNCF